MFVQHLYKQISLSDEQKIFTCRVMSKIIESDKIQKLSASVNYPLGNLHRKNRISNALVNFGRITRKITAESSIDGPVTCYLIFIFVIFVKQFCVRSFFSVRDKQVNGYEINKWLSRPNGEKRTNAMDYRMELEMAGYEKDGR